MHLVTLSAPSVSLTSNSSDEVVIYLKMSEANWKGLTDGLLENLYYQVIIAYISTDSPIGGACSLLGSVVLEPFWQ